MSSAIADYDKEMEVLKDKFESPTSNINQLKRKSEAEKLIHDASTEFVSAKARLTKALEEYHTAIASGDPSPEHRSQFLEKCRNILDPAAKAASVTSQIADFYREDIVYLPLVMVHPNTFDDTKRQAIADHFQNEFNQQFFGSKAAYLKDVESSERAESFKNITHLELDVNSLPDDEGWEAVSEDSFRSYMELDNYVIGLNEYGNEAFAHARDHHSQAHSTAQTEIHAPRQAEVHQTGSTDHATQ